MRSLLHASHVGTFFIVYAPRMMSAAKNVMIKNLVNLTNRKPKQGEKTMIPVKTKLRIMVQSKSEKDGIGTFLQYVEPRPLAGVQYSQTYHDCSGLFASFEYRKAKADGLL